MSFLKPKYFFAGVISGIAACSIAGYVISQHARYNHFTRFFSYISNALDHFPLADELLATAKHKIPKDKILVLIGGSSILRGDGQNEDDLWSIKLQEKLGDQYYVLNYGYNGAQFPSFGGVAYRILSEHYPKTIFVSTCTIAEANEIDGGNTYGYLFWDAYYKNLFHPTRNEVKTIKQMRSAQLKNSAGIELHLMSYLDSKLYFRNLWNWVSYRYVFTVWNKNAYPNTLQARRHFRDTKIDNEALVATTRKNIDRLNSEVKSLHSMGYEKEVDLKTHHLTVAKKQKLIDAYDHIFDQRYRHQALCIFSTYNSRHITKLSKEEQIAYKILINDSASLVRQLGYNAITTKNVLPNDYVDFMHYVASGGEKIATQAAKEIKIIAKNHKYL